MSGINPEQGYAGTEPKKEKASTKETKTIDFNQFHTEIVDLPSKGKLYDDENPLSSGKVELKYMTAKEEDMLTSQNLIKQGVVIDKLLKELIVSNGEGKDVPYHKMLIGDKNAVMVAARVLAYGKDYVTEMQDPFSPNSSKQEVHIDLLKLEDKEIDEDLWEDGNLFVFTLPASKHVIEFSLLTHGDETRLGHELKALKKSKRDYDPELTIRFRNMIKSVDGVTDPRQISKFVDNMLSRDTLELRKFINKVTPDLDMRFLFESEETGEERWMTIPMGVSFFWPGVEL